jgi:hypothetical protein
MSMLKAGNTPLHGRRPSSTIVSAKRSTSPSEIPQAARFVRSAADKTQNPQNQHSFCVVDDGAPLTVTLPQAVSFTVTNDTPSFNANFASRASATSSAA